MREVKPRTFLGMEIDALEQVNAVNRKKTGGIQVIGEKMRDMGAAKLGRSYSTIRQRWECLVAFNVGDDLLDDG